MAVRSRGRGIQRAQRTRGPRRVVDVARVRSTVVGASGGTALILDTFATYKTKAGILTIPPGITIVGIRYSLNISFTAVQLNGGAGVDWGFIVAPDTSDADDLDPSLNTHLDWMEWGSSRHLSVVTAGGGFSMVGNGDDGFRTVRSMRKISEIGLQLFFMITPTAVSGTFGYGLAASIHFKLP
jgi:hypothetical protein